MRALDPSNQQLNAFFDRLAAAPARALLLDYDGALAPFHVQSDQAVPYPGLRRILADLQAAGHTRLVIVSGRYSHGIVPLLAMDDPLEIWGSHGWERRFPDGRTEIGHMDPLALQGLAEADDWTDAQGLAERCEQKPGCLALDLRGLPEAQAAALREKTLEAWRDIVWRTKLDLTEFDDGVELRVPGRTKSDTVRTILSELPTGATVAYLGNDRTDEGAFKTLGRRGLTVLVRPEFRPSAARVWLRPPVQLIEFLRRWHDAARDGKSP